MSLLMKASVEFPANGATIGRQSLILLTLTDMSLHSELTISYCLILMLAQALSPSAALGVRVYIVQPQGEVIGDEMQGNGEPRKETYLRYID